METRRQHRMQSMTDELFLVKWATEYELLSNERHYGNVPLLAGPNNIICSFKVKNKAK
jgi:hypothetical protein